MVTNQIANPQRRNFLKLAGKAAGLTGLASILQSCGDSKSIQRKERSVDLFDARWYEYTDNRNPANPVIYHSSLDGNLDGVEVRKRGNFVHYYKVQDETQAFRDNTDGVNFRGDIIPARTDSFAIPWDNRFWIKYEDSFREMLSAYERQ